MPVPVAAAAAAGRMLTCCAANVGGCFTSTLLREESVEDVSASTSEIQFSRRNRTVKPSIPTGITGSAFRKNRAK